MTLPRRFHRDLMARPLGRRDLLRRLGLGLAALPLIQAACASDDAGVGPDAASGGDGGIDSPTPTGWATGGTAAMTDKATYPDPFTGALSSCVLVATTTEGPCTTATDLSREDISEAWDGLPVRFGLKVVNSSCSPLANVVVKIWHTNKGGSYSGVTPNPSMCLSNQSYSSANFFRGTRTTDANGVVYFDTCFPGWYRGRAVHIHFQVKNGATSYRVSQLFFPEDVTAGVFSTHPQYSAAGQPDTTFANDNIIGAIATAERPRHILDVAKMTDGAMLATKVVTVM